MKRIFSGVKPSGPLHLGNYLGALRNWVDLQREYESLFCIVNLHAITVPQNPQELRARTRETARLYLAVGIDPEISTVFIQSDVAAHAELTWLLNCVARMSELERMTQFKDKVRKQSENVGVGFFDYPVLMAADILLYQTDLVPVGEDQKQHLELTRDLAIRFNRDYGATFRIPDAFIPKVGARIMSLSDPRKKMSKSDEEGDAGCVMLMDSPDTVLRKFKRAVTDSGTEIRFDENRPALSNLLSIYQLLTSNEPAEVEARFSGKGYAVLKQELADVTIAFLQPLQERAEAIDSDKLEHILERGAAKATSIAAETLKVAKTNFGIQGAGK
ncbi:MAG: tryptophanyl-tRNA synthetase [Blastocatellia bacterium]|jgi:tryptophanyl-tRNA synthetase|nr:tryptophanyl-tRNA synthetase [Blastocatellia bacterium]